VFFKGGGGGTFGVVTRVTVKTHDLPESFGWTFGKIKANSDAAFQRLIGQFIDFYRESLFNPHWANRFTSKAITLFSSPSSAKV